MCRALSSCSLLESVTVRESSNQHTFEVHLHLDISVVQKAVFQVLDYQIAGNTALYQKCWCGVIRPGRSAVVSETEEVVEMKR